MFINKEKIEKILKDTSYTRTSGTAKELACAEYIASVCSEMGLDSSIEEFPIRMYKQKKSVLVVDGKKILCTAWRGSSSGNVCGELYILEGNDAVSISQCKGKIVLCLKTFKGMFNKLYEYGVKAVITFNGDMHWQNKDVDERYIGYKLCEGNNIVAVNINIKDAYSIVKSGCSYCEISTEIVEYEGKSCNVICDISGKSGETVLVCAHYDSTKNSKGAFDNMTGCICLLYLADYFRHRKCERTIRLLWCGSEETGLVGSQSYCKYHAEDLKNTVLNVNLDMLGCVMGTFTCFSCSDEQMESYFKSFNEKLQFPAEVKLAIRSSDSNSFVYAGVPAVSFARYGVGDTGVIHTRFDTTEMVGVERLIFDCDYVAKLVDNAVNLSEGFPESVEICSKIKDEVDNYMKNKIDLL